MGLPGSGKTTLLRTVLGAVDLYDGEVLINGVATSKKRPRVGYVPQLETIDWNFPVTVQEVVMMKENAVLKPYSLTTFVNTIWTLKLVEFLIPMVQECVLTMVV